MGFDKNDSTPIIETAKKTTKVNISLAVGVVIFLVVGVVAIVLYGRYH
jgi:hypothetical protein